MRIAQKITSLALLIAAWAFASSALAVTPAKTQLSATATLTYTGNSTGITSSVTVEVQLVPAAVTIAATKSAPNASVNKAENQAYSATYWVQSNANGKDTYTVAASYTATGTVTSPTTPAPSVTTLTLGATAAQAASTGTSITVPSDGAADNSVNGIEQNDTVVVNGGLYTVSSITDNATGTSTIVLDSSASTLSVAIGDGIFEYKQFTTDISDVGSQGGGTNTLTVRTSVTSDTSPNPAYTFDVDINIVAITMNKFVRVVGASSCTGCTGLATYATNNYYASGVTAAPGETLEYLLVITTSTASITNAAITDLLPDYTTYVASSTSLNGISVNDSSSPAFPLDSANGGLLLDDNGSRTAGSEGTGSIGTSQTVYVTYRVTVNN